MGTIEDKLRYLAKTKKDIMNALKSKGVEIDESTPFSEYDVMVKSIQGGGDILLCKNMEELEEKGELSPGSLAMVYDEETDTFGGIYEATETGLQVLPTQLTADATNVAPGVKAFGPNGIVEGTFTSDATAAAIDILAPNTAYINGQKVVGQMIPTYTTVSSTLKSPSTITNNTGDRMIDISNKFGFCLLATALPTTEYKIGIIKGSSLIISNNKITLESLGLPRTALLVDASIAKVLNEDGTLTVGISVENSGNFIYMANLDLKDFTVKSYKHNLTSFLGVQADLNNKFVVEMHPKNSKVMILTAYYSYRYTTFLAIEEGDVVNVTSILAPSKQYNQAMGYIAWKPDGTAFRIHAHDSELSYYASFDLISKSATLKATFNRGFTFLQDDYILLDTGIVYRITDTTNSIATIPNFMIGNQLNASIIYSIDNYVMMHSLNNFFKVYKIDTKTWTATQLYSYSYSMDNNVNNRRTVAYGSLEDNYISVTPVSNLTICRVLNITLDEVLQSVAREDKILVNTSDTTATAADILVGETAYSLNNKVIGTMPNRGARVITPGDYNITIPAGYHNGSGYVRAVNITALNDYKLCDAIADSILEGTTPYIPLEYIQSSGTQWIDTGVGANATSLKYEAKFALPTGATDGFLWSQWNADVYGLGDLYNDKTVNKMCYFYKGTYVTINSPGFTYDTEFVISSDMTLSQITTTLNGTTTTQTRSASAVPYSIKLFRRGNDTSRYWGMYKLYYLKIYVNGTLSRDFIPVKDFNGKIGLYDKVSETFFYNQGTGEFIEGGAV